MKVEVFLEELGEELELESRLERETIFKELGEWDSLTSMVLIGYISRRFNLSLNAEDLEEMSTIEDLMLKVGKHHFEE